MLLRHYNKWLRKSSYAGFLVSISETMEKFRLINRLHINSTFTCNWKYRSLTLPVCTNRINFSSGQQPKMFCCQTIQENNNCSVQLHRADPFICVCLSFNLFHIDGVLDYNFLNHIFSVNEINFPFQVTFIEVNFPK